MDIQSIIPSMDPIPLPAPYWLFKLLLVLTFVLHIIAMNTMLGSGIIALIVRFKSNSNELLSKLFTDLSKKIPTFLAATVTLGVAPLLFLQVLYGQYFYSSSAIMGWPWFSVVPLLIIAYYGFYFAAFKSKENNVAVKWIMFLSVTIIFIIGFIYSNNITLMTSPHIWKAKYLDDPSGMNLNWQETTLIPRYLHFVVASIAVGGLFVGLLGALKWKKENDLAKLQINLGVKIFSYSTMAQILIGIIFLVLLPKDLMMLFMGKNILATILFVVGLALAIIVIFIAKNLHKQENPRKYIYRLMGFTFVLVSIMAIMREILQDGYLSESFNSMNFATATQWEVLPLFLILFLGGVGLWLFMFKKYFTSIREN